MTTTTGKQKRWCEVSGHELELSDIIENSIRIGKDNIFFLPSFGSRSSTQRVTSPISFNVMERTSLASLDEGVIMGASYRVYPSSNEDEMGLDVSNAPDQNILIFKGLCGSLFDLDQGLVCSSMCNIETMKDATFLCYYLLIPSQNGQMLLRVFRDWLDQKRYYLIQIRAVPVISVCLRRLRAPFKNLCQRFVTPICPKTTPMRNILKSASSPMSNISTEKVNRVPSRVTEEWEQLVVLDDDESTNSTSANFEFKPEATTSKILSQSKPMDEKTTRILERLEPPKLKRQQKKDISGVAVNGVAGQMKKPFLPFDTNSKLNLSQSQPMRPNFQRMKKKQKIQVVAYSPSVEVSF